jgi:hypothetical protein
MRNKEWNKILASFCSILSGSLDTMVGQALMLEIEKLLWMPASVLNEQLQTADRGGWGHWLGGLLLVQ